MIERIAGIDYLRALMSVCVVAWHMNIAGSSVTYPKAEYFQRSLTVSDIVNFHILLLAVPTFMFISNYLYARNGPSAAVLQKRLRRLLLLLTFWPLAWILYNKGYRGLFEIVPHSVSAFAVAVMQAGYTIYYFFVSLMVCLLVTHWATALPARVQVGGFIVSTALLSVLPQLSSTSGLHALSAYWSPLNFVPFSFAAVLVAKHRDYIRSKKTLLSVVLIVLSAALSKFEWHFSAGDIFFPDGGYAIPPYTRSSLVFAVLAICIVAVESSIKDNVMIRFMAKYSLALYCLHLFVMEPMKRLVSRISQDHLIVTSVSFVLVIMASYAIAMLLRFYLREEVIM